ncbi:hypothetical protein [Azospirillum argentinense]|uniref:hypothetical protein n=1 Tax=Azospirillum argentinense TaxID=2970906 RepID=UPI0032DEAB0B
MVGCIRRLPLLPLLVAALPGFLPPAPAIAANAFDDDEFDRIYEEHSAQQPDAKCFQRDDFNACMELVGKRGRTNRHIVEKLSEIAGKSRQRHQLETLLALPGLHYEQDLLASVTSNLQAVYRRDAKATRDGSDYLKSFAVRANEEDLKSLLTLASTDTLYRALSDENVTKTIWDKSFRGQAAQRFLAEGGAKGYFYAFAATGDSQHLRKAMDLVGPNSAGFAPDLYSAYARTFVGSMDGAAAYARHVEKCSNCDKATLYSFVGQIPDFGRNTSLSGFLTSPEYAFYFSKLSYSVEEKPDGQTYRAILSARGKSLALDASGSCVETGTESESVRLGFGEHFVATLSSGREVEGKLQHYRVLRCTLSDPALATVRRLASRGKLDLAERGWRARIADGEELVLGAAISSSSSSSASPQRREPERASSRQPDSRPVTGVKTVRKADLVAGVQYHQIVCQNGSSKIVGQHADGRWRDSVLGEMGDRFRNMSLTALGNEICG